MSYTLGCFFPTTVVAVDDDIVFLNGIKDFLQSNNIPCKTFNDPVKALDFINEVGESNKLDYSDLIIDGEEGTSSWKSILFNVNNLHKEIYNESRFMTISVVISDYMMPNMTGIELCSKIFDKDIQRILLTGMTEDKTAIEAFNKGYITHFINKRADNFPDELLAGINKSFDNYFRTYTNYIAKHISVVNGTHLNDSVFAAFFKQILNTNNGYSEYYMLDAFGSYLLLNPKGQFKMLSVLTENEIGRLVDVGMESGETDEDVLAKLQSRQYILTTHSRVGLLPPVSEWGKYLQPAGRLDGYQTYYYTMSNEADLEVASIKSFESFLKKIDAAD
jgi:CheY-like chemotaxis protein